MAASGESSGAVWGVAGGGAEQVTVVEHGPNLFLPIASVNRGRGRRFESLANDAHGLGPRCARGANGVERARCARFAANPNEMLAVRHRSSASGGGGVGPRGNCAEAPVGGNARLQKEAEGGDEK